jgi:hypothetical protein
MTGVKGTHPEPRPLAPPAPIAGGRCSDTGRVLLLRYDTYDCGRRRRLTQSLRPGSRAEVDPL